MPVADNIEVCAAVSTRARHLVAELRVVVILLAWCAVYGLAALGSAWNVMGRVIAVLFLDMAHDTAASGEWLWAVRGFDNSTAVVGIGRASFILAHCVFPLGWSSLRTFTVWLLTSTGLSESLRAARIVNPKLVSFGERTAALALFDPLYA
jgi:hypothetical protein